MQLPLSLYISLRYLSIKRRNRFISFITSISILGIALSIIVLTVVLSLMNGFDQTIKDKIFNTAHHITIQNTKDTAFKEWETLRKRILKESNILGVAPFLNSQGLLLASSSPYPVSINGVLPQLEKTISLVPNKLIAGNFDLRFKKNKMIIGEQIALNLGLTIGSTINLLVSTASEQSDNIVPQFKTFTITGIFRAGKEFNFDGSTVYVHLKDMQDLYQTGQIITGLRIKTDHLYRAPQLAARLSKTILSQYLVSNWTHHYGHLISLIDLEKTMMFCTLLLLIAIAAFNLVSSLTMLVTEKQSDIAILRTLGLHSRTIVGIFMIQGTLIGCIGILLGLLAGIPLAQYINDLVHLLEKLLGLQILSTNPYIFENQLPSKIEIVDLIKVSIASLSMSIIATLYPARRAAKTIPAKALRYE